MWIPPKVRKELLAGTLRHNAAVREQTFEDEWTKRVQQIDDKLEVRRAPEKTDVAGLKPGFFHCLRWNEGAPPTIRVIEHEDGSFRVPDSSLLEDLARSDMWSNVSRKEAEKASRLAEQAAASQRERERQDRVGEVNERVAAARRLQVRF